MILIGQYDSPFVRRVAVTLRRYRLGYEHWPWSVWSDVDQLAAYNPLRRVPVLVLDDGCALVETAYIVDTLDELVGPERALWPMEPAARREARRVVGLASGLADKAASLLYERLLRPVAERSAVWSERCRAQLGDTLARLEDERRARSSRFWLGDEPGHADLALACTLRFAGEAHAELMPATRWPALAALAARCEELPEMRAALQPLTLP